MRLTINLPWFTYSRRLTVAVIAMMLLLAAALPASGAPPQGVSGEVMVVNDETNPVPVTVENEVAVTGGNNTPVNVSGEVTVGNVPANPVPVAVQNGPVATLDTVNAIASSISEGSFQAIPAPEYLSVVTVSVSPGERIRVQIVLPAPGGVVGVTGVLFNVAGGDHGDVFSQTFPVPIQGATNVVLTCVEAADGVCGVNGGVVGF